VNAKTKTLKMLQTCPVVKDWEMRREVRVSEFAFCARVGKLRSATKLNSTCIVGSVVKCSAGRHTSPLQTSKFAKSREDKLSDTHSTSHSLEVPRLSILAARLLDSHTHRS
jgi:hypothetical protein